MDRTLREKLSKPTGFVLFVIWLLFLAAPFASFPGMRDRIFLPSAEWNAHFPWAVLQGTFLGFIVLTGVVGITAVCLIVFAGRDPASAGNVKRVMFWLWFIFLLVLPLWGWGFERGYLRVWAHEAAPTLDHTVTDATVVSYYVTSTGRRGRSTEVPHLHLRVPPHGRLEIDYHPPFIEGFAPSKGDVIQIEGRRTWVGTSYEELIWPGEWLAEPGLPW